MCNCQFNVTWWQILWSLPKMRKSIVIVFLSNYQGLHNSLTLHESANPRCDFTSCSHFSNLSSDREHWINVGHVKWKLVPIEKMFHRVQMQVQVYWTFLSLRHQKVFRKTWKLFPAVVVLQTCGNVCKTCMQLGILYFTKYLLQLWV